MGLLASAGRRCGGRCAWSVPPPQLPRWPACVLASAGQQRAAAPARALTDAAVVGTEPGDAQLEEQPVAAPGKRHMVVPETRPVRSRLWSRCKGAVGMHASVPPMHMVARAEPAAARPARAAPWRRGQQRTLLVLRLASYRRWRHRHTAADETGAADASATGSPACATGAETVLGNAASRRRYHARAASAGGGVRARRGTNGRGSGTEGTRVTLSAPTPRMALLLHVTRGGDGGSTTQPVVVMAARAAATVYVPAPARVAGGVCAGSASPV